MKFKKDGISHKEFLNSKYAPKQGPKRWININLTGKESIEEIQE